jgi:hypothetical protein
MISNLYERRLLDQILEVPRHVALVIAEADLDTVDAYKRIGAFASWCTEIGISRVTVYRLCKGSPIVFNLRQWLPLFTHPMPQKSLAARRPPL